MSGILQKWRLQFLVIAAAMLASMFLIGNAAAQSYTTPDTCSGPGSPGYKWCLNADGVTGWCSYNSSPTYTCPAMTESACSAQAGRWCKTDATNGWCASGSMTCPINTESECKATPGKSWCTSGAYGWCSDFCSSSGSGTPTTPGSTTPSSGSTGSTPSSDSSTGTTPSSGSNTTPVEDPAVMCGRQGYKWCKSAPSSSTMSSGGYCNYGSSPCPVYTEAECKETSGEWCSYTGTTSNYNTSSGYTMTGWCAYTPSTCPIYEESTCTTKGRKWCKYTYTGTMSMGSNTVTGWCANPGDTCPSNGTTVTSTPVIAQPPTQPTAPTTTVITPPPAPEKDAYKYSAWPTYKRDCERYYGKWCTSSTGSGSCILGTKSCPVAPKAGYMGCWDNSQVATGSSCPSMPLTESDCAKATKFWCTYTSGGSSSSATGWCSAEPCSPMAPAGSILCPDGRSTAGTLGSCPWDGDGNPPPPPIDVFTTCTDGSKVRQGQACPTTYQCKNGKTVASANECEKEDLVTQCLNANGTWCSSKDTTTGGWCAARGTRCTSPYSNEEQQNLEKHKGLSNEQMLKRFEQEKQDLLNRINEVMRYLRRINNTEALGKAAAVKEQIQQLNPKNPAIIDNPFKTIESLREEIGLLFEVINVYNEKEGTEVQQYDLDDTFRDRALKQMQQGVASFEKYLATLDKKIAAVEKQKVAGVAQCKTTIAAAREMASKVKAAKTYEEVRDLMDMMPEKAEELNECLHRLEQLTRLPRAIRYVNTKLTVTRTTVTRTLASAKRLKLDVTEPVERMRASLKEMEAAVVAVRAGTFEGEDLMEYIQTEVFDRADEIQEIAAGIEALTNVKRYVTQGTASIRRFTTLIASAERRKRDVTEAKEMLAELKEHHGELVTLSKARLTEDLVPEIIEHAQMMRDVTNDLADALAVDIDQNELQTRRSLESGGTTFDKAEVDDIENLIVRAFRVANYFRSNPMRSLAVLIY